MPDAPIERIRPHTYEYATKIAVECMKADDVWTYLVVPIKSNLVWIATVAVFDETGQFLGYL